MYILTDKKYQIKNITNKMVFSNIIKEVRSSRTAVALLFALLSVVYTYIEVRSSTELKRTILGIYLRNFTFSFIIVYLSLIVYNGGNGISIGIMKGGSGGSTQTILTGRPNF